MHDDEYPELTIPQANLVRIMCEGTHKLADAIEAAGYASRSAGYHAWRQQSVQGRYQERCLERLAGQVPMALNSLAALVSGARSEKVRLEAAAQILDRTGLRAQTERQLGSLEVHISLDAGGGGGEKEAPPLESPGPSHARLGENPQEAEIVSEPARLLEASAVDGLTELPVDGLVIRGGG